MFNQLLRMMKTPAPASTPRGRQDLRLSVAVLLVEAARQDDTFDAQERAGIQNLLTRKFDISADECRVLLAAAETRAGEMVQMHGHTSAVFEQMEYEDRVQLVEMLWDVAYADGVLDPEEDLLIRRISGLMYVTDRDRVLARQRVVTRLGLKIV